MNYKCNDILKNFSDIKYNDYDIIFFACPNGTAMNAYSEFKDSKAKIIDLAADYRLDRRNYGKNIMDKIINVQNYFLRLYMD